LIAIFLPSRGDQFPDFVNYIKAGISAGFEPVRPPPLQALGERGGGKTDHWNNRGPPPTQWLSRSSRKKREGGRESQRLKITVLARSLDLGHE